MHEVTTQRTNTTYNNDYKINGKLWYNRHFNKRTGIRRHVIAFEHYTLYI
jgi:hypothetical protein